jgi:hypothetical protein
VAMGIFIVGDDEKRMGKGGKAQRQREVLPASAIMESYPPVAVSMTGMARHAPRRCCVAPGTPSLSLGGGDILGAPDPVLDRAGRNWPLGHAAGRSFLSCLPSRPLGTILGTRLEILLLTQCVT